MKSLVIYLALTLAAVSAASHLVPDSTSDHMADRHAQIAAAAE